MKSSVALCTYNGAKYISQQLASIALQSRLPDELVVCDDCSEDATLELVAEFAKTAPFPVRWSKNAYQLGVSKNFEQAITQCNGDIVFLCDQDDVWVNNKVEIMLAEFENNSKVMMVFSNAEVTNEHLIGLGYNVWDTFGFNTQTQYNSLDNDPFIHLIKRYVVTGATAAFRASLIPIAIPIPSYWIHDAWIALIAASCGNVQGLSKNLIKYRQHSKNVIGGARLGIFDRLRLSKNTNSASYQLEIERAQQLLDFVTKELFSIPNNSIASASTIIAEKIRHLELRCKIYDKYFYSRLYLVCIEILSKRYFVFSNGLSSAAADLFLHKRP